MNKLTPNTMVKILNNVNGSNGFTCMNGFRFNLERPGDLGVIKLEQLENALYETPIRNIFNSNRLEILDKDIIRFFNEMGLLDIKIPEKPKEEEVKANPSTPKFDKINAQTLNYFLTEATQDYFSEKLQEVPKEIQAMVVARATKMYKEDPSSVSSSAIMVLKTVANKDIIAICANE